MLKSILCAVFPLVGGFSAAADAPMAWHPKDGTTIEFDVLRKGKPFGTHRLEFSDRGDGQFSVTTDVDLDVGLGPLSLFKYRLDSEELWDDGRLVQLTAKSNNDGRKGKVSAISNRDILSVDSTAFVGNIDTPIVPSSHWNIEQIRSDRMISTETGEILDIDVVEIGPDIVNVNGEPVDATHYRLTSDLIVDLWYDSQNRWVKLTFEARDQKIEYVLRELY